MIFFDRTREMFEVLLLLTEVIGVKMNRFIPIKRETVHS